MYRLSSKSTILVASFVTFLVFALMINDRNQVLATDSTVNSSTIFMKPKKIETEKININPEYNSGLKNGIQNSRIQKHNTNRN